MARHRRERDTRGGNARGNNEHHRGESRSSLTISFLLSTSDDAIIIYFSIYDFRSPLQKIFQFFFYNLLFVFPECFYPY